MPTLREAIQAKIDAANALSVSLNAEMDTNVTNFGDWLDQDPIAFKAKVDAFQAEISKHIG